MAQHHYFRIFKRLNRVRHIQRKDRLYKYIKELFFDFHESKWNIQMYKKFVEEHNLNYEICYYALNDIFNSYINLLPKHKGFILFLEKIKKLNGVVYLKKIPIKKEMGLKGVGAIIKAFRENSNITLEQCFNLVSDNFDTGLAKSTLRSYYFDRKLE